MKISVIIPSYNDTEKLQKCLMALANQSISPDLFEVIVVDNHDSSKITQEDISCLDHAIITHEPRGGSYAARNHGVSLAKGECLLFTDADCVPSRNWIEKAIEIGVNRIVGGKVELIVDEKSSNLELYEKVFYFNQQAYIEKDHYAVTANLLVPTSIMKEVGPFDSSLRSGGDRVWGQLATSKNFKIYYEKNLKVQHPTRSEWREFFKRRVRVLSGNLYLFHREVGLTWEKAWQKISYIGNMKNFRSWTGDWEFYDSLPENKKKSIKLLHRLFTFFDILIILRCKLSYKKMKELTLIDRNL